MATLIMSRRDGCDSGKRVQYHISLGNPMKEELEEGQAGMSGLAVSESGACSKKARINEEGNSVNVEEKDSAALLKSADVINEEPAARGSTMESGERSPSPTLEGGVETEVKWSTRPVALYAKLEFKAQDSRSLGGSGGSLRRCRTALVDLRTILDAEEAAEEEEQKHNRARFSIGGDDENDRNEKKLVMRRIPLRVRFRPRGLYTIIEVDVEEDDD
ncbi:unnamed protein product [Orchesella dallaii]|uniref:Uncharacterized protein n=1 Tax=Orchesella dallaii TaxID=48710 RepID=A0ABP1PZB1_9HEXA